MIGMLIAHYVESTRDIGVGIMVRDFVDGRAMPLFMVLGGVGISFLAKRSPAPDRDLSTRALILFPMGLALQEFTTDIAIILQYYALFFLVAIGLRRLTDKSLLMAAVALILLGAYAKQMWAPLVDSYDGWEGASTLFRAGTWWSLVVSGYYPFLPAGAFLTTGMWLGRRDLRSPRFATRLAVVGIALAFTGSWVGAWIGDEVGASGVIVDEGSGDAVMVEDLVARYSAREALTTADAARQITDRYPQTPAGVEGLEDLASSIERTTAGFRWQRLFDAEGHSQMPAWVIGSTGTSLAVIGGSLLAASAATLTALTLLGEMALTFYAYQAIVINWTPARRETTTAEEYVLCLGLIAGFMMFAFVWRTWRRRGPLETVLRMGSAPRVSPARAEQA